MHIRMKTPTEFIFIHLFTTMYIRARQIYWLVNILSSYSFYSEHDAEKYDLSFLNSQWTLLWQYTDVILEHKVDC